MYSDKCLELFQRPRDKNAPPRDSTFEPLFVSPLRKRSCSVPRLWSCLCLCHRFKVKCGVGGKKCACWGTAKTKAGKEVLEDADGHQGRRCACQRRVRVWAKKNQKTKPEKKMRRVAYKQQTADDHVWELMNP